MTRRAEGGLGPEGGPTACCCAATAAAAATALEVTFEAADEDGVVVVASAAVAAAAAAADAEEELLALVSNIPGGEGSIAAHPNTLHSREIRETHRHSKIREMYSRQLSPVSL